MMDEEKDERQQLRLKVKRLQQEIVERARNYMQSSRHKKKSLTGQKLAAEKEIQTDVCGTQDSENERNGKGDKEVEGEDSDGNGRKWVRQWYNQFVKQVRLAEGKVSQEIGSVAVGDSDAREICKALNKTVEQMVEKIVKAFQLDQQCSESETKPVLDRLQESYLKTSVNIQERLQKQPESKPKSTQQLESKLKQLQVRCEFITKALNESEQANYQLRLQVQESDIKLRNFMDMIEGNRGKTDKYASVIEEMKVKIEQLEVMKREYLRAYSKVKEEKEDLELKYLDLEEQFKNKFNGDTSNSGKDQNWEHYEFIQLGENQQSQQQARLKTIIEHSEDEVIQQVMRKTGSENSIYAIREIIEHGLMETNRSTSEKWIKSALVKLQHLEHSQMEEQEKVATSQTLIETNIHDSYRSLIANIKKNAAKERKNLQDQFNEAINKVIGLKIERESEEQRKNQKIDPVRKQSKEELQQKQPILTSSQREISLQQEKKSEKELEQATFDLMSKLNESHVRYAELKKKYDALIAKQEESLMYSYFELTKSRADFSKFMSKLLEFQVRGAHNRFTEEFFDKLAHKVFETLCNLPTGAHGQVFFVPTNQQELEDALQLIYKFSIEFDSYQEAKLKQFKNQAQSLTKMLEQIAIAKDVSAEMVIESMHQNFDQENTVSGGYVKSLIKKLSHDRKSRSMDSIPKEASTMNELSSKASH